MDNKQILRQEMKKHRLTLTSQFVEQASSHIATSGSRWMLDNKIHTTLFYMPIQQEVNVQIWMEKTWNHNGRIALPRANTDDYSLTCYLIEELSQLQQGAYRILEPDPQRAEPIDPLEIELVLVPGVAFDRQGYRLGYGAGYYDRFLHQYPHFVTLGVAYSKQLISTVYPEQHDQRLMHLITEEHIHTF